MKFHGFLVVNASGGMRIVTREPRDRLYLNEVYFKITVEVPDVWARKAGDILLTVPDGEVAIDGEWAGHGENEEEK